MCPKNLLDNEELLMTTGRDVLLEVTGEIGKREQSG
jgi:hypothetical protein